ncbi:MAG: tRNA (adenosine(37)-N6)-dimethylallyltransferase MiaA [Eubacteriaceae bacterium]|nr:tRNA (adenosine(37)-N6)-dimethylallyltransferase MiaA [Eubacteriaceae bacterium]
MSFSGRLIVMAGPTASGKTDAAYALAELTAGVIVSADCYQCYRRMDIGTAKPPKYMTEHIRHYMIDEYDVTYPVTAFDYSHRALDYMGSLGNRTVILTGGSGLYIDSIVYSSYEFSGENTDLSYRRYLTEIAEARGADALYAKLMEVDPEYAASTHKNNIKRVMRALEFHHDTGNKMSSAKQERVMRFPNTQYYALSVSRPLLYERINARVDRMMEEGLAQEVQELYRDYPDRSLTAFKAIGYKELISAIEGETTIDEAVRLIKKRSRNYAKRQYTWFNANKDVRWIDADEMNSAQIADMIFKGGRNV